MGGIFIYISPEPDSEDPDTLVEKLPLQVMDRALSWVKSARSVTLAVKSARSVTLGESKVPDRSLLSLITMFLNKI